MCVCMCVCFVYITGATNYENNEVNIVKSHLTNETGAVPDVARSVCKYIRCFALDKR